MLRFVVASTEAAGAARFAWARRDGSISGNGSGDIFIAFSTAIPARPRRITSSIEDAAERKSSNRFFRDRSGDRRSDIKRHGRRRNNGRIENHKVIALPHDAIRAPVLEKIQPLEPMRPRLKHKRLAVFFPRSPLQQSVCSLPARNRKTSFWAYACHGELT